MLKNHSFYGKPIQENHRGGNKPVMESPVRKDIRLGDYDYSSTGYYFITICVKDRLGILGRIDVGANCVRPHLSAYGKVVETEIAILSDVYSAVEVLKYVVMPNHIHMIISIGNDGGRTQFAPTVSRIIKQFKGSITKKLGVSIWQKSFNDHIIRNEPEYRRIWQYIDENPVLWSEDVYFVRDQQ